MSDSLWISFHLLNFCQASYLIPLYLLSKLGIFLSHSAFSFPNYSSSIYLVFRTQLHCSHMKIRKYGTRAFCKCVNGYMFVWIVKWVKCTHLLACAALRSSPRVLHRTSFLSISFLSTKLNIFEAITKLSLSLCMCNATFPLSNKGIRWGAYFSRLYFS